MPVENCENNHHQHGRQNKTRHRHAGASPTSQTQSDIRHSIAGARARKTLCQGEAFDEFRVRKPTSLDHRERADLRDDGEAAAKTHQPDLKKRKEETAERRGSRDAF